MKNNQSALKVNDGIIQAPAVSQEAIKRFKAKKRSKYSVNHYVTQILKGDITALSQAITLIESSLPYHQKISQEIIEKCLPFTNNSLRIGITGVPGVGKSTFIESLGKQITSSNRKLAVLAIDPSSERSKGSILGDKTRMEELSTDKNAFIRPSPSSGSLGGVANKTRESIILCEASGFDTIFVETVGVGQSETAVHSMVDFFLLLMLAGAGDELQGIKRGIMEMADAIVITKCDGDNIHKANMAKTEYKNALHLFPPTPSNWIPKVMTCSSLEKKGVREVWETILEYEKYTRENLFFETKRNEQAKYWMYENINRILKDNFYQHHSVKEKINDLEKDVLERKLSPFIASKKLLNDYFKKV